MGALSYAATSTRPDISHAVNQLARLIAAPTDEAVIAAKRVLRYLAGTHSIGLKYSSNSDEIRPAAYSDSDWAGSKDAKSTSGMLVKLGGAAILWGSQKQSCVATSTSEAEYIAASETARDICWVRNFLRAIHLHNELPTPLYVDNQVAISIIKDDRTVERRKHINVRYHYIREKYLEKELSPEWVPTEFQQADILTKPLSGIMFNRLRDSAMGHFKFPPQ